jgi:creatinine amidohydrolase
MDWITSATSPEAGGKDTAVLPVGSFEQHGSFLPLVTDSIVAGLIAGKISQDYGLFCLPPITVSCSHEHSAFPGTVSISARTLHVLIEEISDSARSAGMRRLVIVGGHGGNYVIQNVVQEANAEGRITVLFPAKADWDRARKEAGMESSHSHDMHAGELETSLLLYATPDLVRDSYRDKDFNTYPRPHLLLKGMRGYTETGVLGYPSLASAEKGKALLESLSRCFEETLAVLSE